MIKISKLIEDYYGKGGNIVVPFSKKLTGGYKINISKYSGLVSVIKRRNSAEIAKEWSEKIFGRKFSKKNYTSKIPAVVARHTYLIETITSKLKLRSKSVCDFGAGEGEFLKILKKRIDIKPFGIEPSKKNCHLLKKNKIKHFAGTIEEYYKLKNKKKFDLATIMWTLCNTSNSFEMIKIAHELIKDNGYLVIAESSRILVPFKKPIQMYFGKNKPDLHPFHFSKNSLNNILVLNKFRPIYINRYIDSDYIVIIAKKIKKIENHRIKIDNYLKVKEFFKRWYQESQRYKSEII